MDRCELRWDGKQFPSLYTAIQQLPADIDKGIKIKTETEREKQIPSFLLAVRDKAE
jgi:hypothetical protein